MPEIPLLGFLSLGPIVGYLWSLTPESHFTPQLLALLIIAAIYYFKKNLTVFIVLTSYVLNLLVFTTGGTTSSVFFLVYFLLFIIGFQFRFLVSIAYSLILLIVFAQSLNSFSSFLTLCSLLLVPPLVWFISGLKTELAKEETDFNLWSSLNLRSGLNRIADTASYLQTTILTNDQRRLVQSIRSSVTSLLRSLDNLKKDL